MNRSLVLSVSLAVASSCVSAVTWDLARVAVVEPAAPSELQQVAVRELKRHLTMVAGTAFDDAAPQRFVFAKPADAPAPASCESRYRIDGATVSFWGDDGGPEADWDWGDNRGSESQKRAGTLFAVSLFLEKELGVRWLWPGDDGVSYRPQKTVRLRDRAEESFVTPMVKSRIRNYYQYGTHKYLQFAAAAPKALRGMLGVESDDLAGDYARRQLWIWMNRLQDRDYFSYGHAFTDWKRRFQATHPDYLNYTRATKDRGNTKSAGPERSKLCVSNEAVVDRIVADWLAAGTNRYLNVCENDSANWCECDACRALDVRRKGEAEFTHVTDRYVNLWNRIAKKARAVRPDVVLVTYIYSAYRLPPRRERIAYPENMLFGIVPSVLDDVVTDMVKPWRAAGMRQFFLRPNHLHYIGCIPRGLERHFYDEFRACRELGMVGVDYDANINRPANAIEFYTLARLFADPEKPFEEIIDEYCAGFGSAKDDVKRYFAAVRETGEAARRKCIADRFDGRHATDDSELPLQAYGRNEEELVAKAALVRDAVRRHADEPCPLARRRLENLAIQAEQAVLVYRMFAAKKAGREALRAACEALTAFRLAHKAALPDDYAAIYGGGGGTESECHRRFLPKFQYEIDLSTARIEVRDPKNPTQKLAAEELEKHLKLLAGERRPSKKKGYRFVIGTRPPAGKESSDWMSLALATNDAMYFWGDDTKVSKGAAHKGSLFAVYGFLEKLAGVRWVRPGDDGIVFSPKKKVGVPLGWSYRFYPPLGMSTLRGKANTHAWMEMNGECPNALRITDEVALQRGTDAWLWNLRQRHQTREVFSYRHAFVDWNPRYIHDHPEYLAMDEKGVRGNPKGPKFDGKRVQICLSNPAVQDRILADWMAEGTNRYLNVCPNDSRAHCHCADCRAWDADEPGEDFNAHKSDRYVKFWNILIEKARRVRPDVQLVTYVYSNWRLPPRRERIAHPENFIAGIVPSIYEDSCPLIEAWRKLGMKTYFVRPNYLCYGSCMPRGLERFLVEDFKANLALGMMGVDEDNWRRGPLMDFEFYAMSRIIADPTLAFATIENDFVSQFGAAGGDMKAYYARVRARGEAARLKIVKTTGGQKIKALDDSLLSGSAYDGHTEADLAGDLEVIDRALARGDLTSAERRRVREVRLTVEHAILALRFVTLSTAGHSADAFRQAADALLAFRFAHKDELIDNWGQVMRCYPIEVRLWMRYGIRKRFPEMKKVD